MLVMTFPGEFDRLDLVSLKPCPSIDWTQKMDGQDSSEMKLDRSHSPAELLSAVGARMD